jgi:hypothetical protein
MNSLRFQDHDRNPPPDFQSRSVQMKLLGLVFTLMLVIALAVKARDPANYSWMWRFGRPDESAEVTADTRIPKFWANSDPLAALEGPAGHIQRDFLAELSLSLKDGQKKALLHRVNQILVPMWHETDPREGGVAAGETITAATDDAATDDAATDDAATDDATTDDAATDDALAALGLAVQRYAEDAQSKLGDRDQRWLQALADWRESWEQQAIPRLRSPAKFDSSTSDGAISDGAISDGAISDGAAAIGSIRVLQAWLEESFLARVKDNTMLERHDSMAWWAMLRRVSEDREGRESPAVTRLQLAEQPTAYRGRRVKVRGRVLKAYEVPADENPFGITHYNVLWLRPEGGDYLPITAYCLELPAKFPVLHALTEDGNQLHEDVQVNGWFYKHWAYSSKSGLSLAPLLVVDSPVWYPRPPDKNKETSQAIVIAQLLLAAMAALVISRLVYRWSRWKNVSRRSLAGQNAIAELGSDNLGPTVSDGLQQMEREANE